MNRVLWVAPAVLLSLTLGGCTGGGPAAPVSEESGPANATNVGVSEEGHDVGNGRPEVTFDGLMVRRRVVIAVESVNEADLGGVRKDLETAAAAVGSTLASISPDVLEPALLLRMVPELILALPATATVDQGRAIVNKAIEGMGTAKTGVENFYVLPVLVHDLRFSATTADPAALSAAVDGEGIVSDALGNYDTTVEGQQISIAYTGPLLGDGIVESVRAGIARQARVTASAIAVGPRATTGSGVDMASEPAWDEELETEKEHPHSGG